MLAGVSMGQAVIFPTHNSLLADYYSVPARPRIYSAHRSGISFGAIIGVLLGAGLAAIWSWRTPFYFFAMPDRRGRHRRAAAARTAAGTPRATRAERADDRVRTGRARSPLRCAGQDGRGRRSPGDELPVEPPPSLGEAWRTVWKIGVLRRIFIALPFLAASIAGFTSLASLQYQETFHLDAVDRAYLIAPVQIFDLLGLAAGAIIATRLAARDIGLVFRMLAVASVIAAAFAVLFALAPSVPIAFIGNAGIDASLAIVGPGVLAAALPGHPRPGTFRRLLHRRALRAPRVPCPPHRRCGGRCSGLSLWPPHPCPHLCRRRA